QQSAFQLDKAFASAVKAADLAETESLAWARVAELALSLGKTRQAASAAKKALALNPSFSRAYSIKSFLALKRHQPDTAFKYFTQALELDPADPLARFALGLADIRRGRLKQGRESLELAVALNPGNSLFRSYLGKAYFEENRNAVAGAQFALARQLDPDDPTPWFYQAVLLQSENQPYQALQAMTESIERNGKRAVYRSRLLLDADEAARQTSQADIYLDLGFDELAKRRAATSLAMAPDEHGGHRLLAESLINDSRADIARSSEVLQAQLLQPLTATPLRSVLAEQDLLTIDGAGPGKLGVNEFNSLFNRNDFHLQTSGLTGSNQTNATDTVLSGLFGPVSFALEDYNYHTDGYRENNDLEYDISTVFVQGQLSDSLKLMVEGRSRKEDRGDLTQRFLAGVFSETERLQRETENARFGFHYTPSSSFVFLGVFDYIENNLVSSFETLVLSTPFFDVMQDSLFEMKERADASELQFIFKQNDMNGIVGFKKARIDREEVEVIEITGFPGPPSLPSITLNTGEREYENAYAYWNISVNKRAALALGMAYVEFNDEVTLQEKFSQWNPKLGIHLQALDDLSIRIAGFRNLKGPLLLEQSLEPTQVVGLNQIRDDADGADSSNLALAIDHQVNENFTLGIELMDRDLERPVAGTASDQELSDKLFSAYAYWALQNGSFSVNYYDEQQDYETEASFVNSPIKLETKRVPLSFNYHYRNGFSFAIEPSYINQHADFRPPSSSDVIVEKENFWIMDLSAKYWFWQKQALIALEVKNAGKKKFRFQNANFQDFSPKPITYVPERTLLGRISIRF
ncbi:MAG TPA: tetratricopeptide repeat protein, partial [Pseudomonadales bacterium]